MSKGALETFFRPRSAVGVARLWKTNKEKKKQWWLDVEKQVLQHCDPCTRPAAQLTALGHFPECTAAPAGREAELTVAVALAEEAESDLGEAGRAGLPEGRKPHRERAGLGGPARRGVPGALAE